MVHDQMRLYVQITLRDIFYFFHSWKEKNKEEHLKEKNNKERGKLQKTQEGCISSLQAKNILS